MLRPQNLLNFEFYDVHFNKNFLYHTFYLTLHTHLQNSRAILPKSQQKIIFILPLSPQILATCRSSTVFGISKIYNKYNNACNECNIFDLIT